MSKPAIEGGTPVCEGISWSEWPIHGEVEANSVASVLESGKWWYGEKVFEFEAAFAGFQRVDYAVSCTNGTAALRMGLFACGIGPGDEVIVPPYTFVATALAPMLLGAVPVFADVELASSNMSVDAVRQAITPATRAIMPVHFAGLPCDMVGLRKLAFEHDLRIVEDACHSWGTQLEIDGKIVGAGAIGDCGAFSFQMSKNMTAGEGGMLISNNAEVAKLARSYANCGRRDGAPWYEHSIIADNLRMTEIQAAILSAQLERLGEHVTRRVDRARILDQTLAPIEGLKLPMTPDNLVRRSYHMYLFRFIQSRWSIDRERFVEALQAEGVPCSTGYPIPLTQQPLFRDKKPAHCPQAEQICREAVWVPHALLLAGESEVSRAAEAIARLAEYYAC